MITFKTTLVLWFFIARVISIPKYMCCRFLNWLLQGCTLSSLKIVPQHKLTQPGRKSWTDFRTTLKNGFKCSLFVLSASGWKYQNMDSSFSRQRKPWYGEGIVRLANRVAVWRQSEVSISWAFASPTKSNARLYLFDNQSNRSISVRLLFLFCSSVFISRS